MRLTNTPTPRPGDASRPLIVFVNAGDPSLDATALLLHALDAAGVAGIELCVPYANPFTDGATLRRSHARALAQGVDLDAVLRMVERLRGEGLRLALYLMVDWSHTVRDLGCEALMTAVGPAQSRKDVQGLLVHGLPPRAREPLEAAARRAGVSLVRTRYLGRPQSPESRLGVGTQAAVAFEYLVSSYGASGGSATPLADALAGLEPAGDGAAPRFVGFGVKDARDVAAVLAAGADGAVIGSAFVAALEPHLDRPDTLAAHARAFVEALCPRRLPIDTPEKEPRPCLA